MAELQNRDGLLDGFDEKLWLASVESVTVHSEKEAECLFKDGSTIRVEL